MSKKPAAGKLDLAKHRGPYDFRELNFLEQTTVLDYTTLSAVFVTLPTALLGSIASSSYRSLFQKKPVDWKDKAYQEAVSHIEQGLNWRQLRVLCPIRPLFEELTLRDYRNLKHYNYFFGGENYSARWLVEKPKRSPSDPVILYMHGGSYALKVQRPQLSYLVGLYKRLSRSDLSILILDYTIGDVAKHPAQLNEGIACYEALKSTCDNIIFFGDSCGGHLALAMLQSGARCESMVLVSPSTDMNSGERDDISMREVFIDPKTSNYEDPLISPLYADPSVWESIVPEDTLVVWGEKEPCKQQMIDWAKKAKVTNTFEEPDGSHDCIIRGNTNSGSLYIEKRLKQWLKT